MKCQPQDLKPRLRKLFSSSSLQWCLTETRKLNDDNLKHRSNLFQILSFPSLFLSCVDLIQQFSEKSLEYYSNQTQNLDNNFFNTKNIECFIFCFVKFKILLKFKSSEALFFSKVPFQKLTNVWLLNWSTVFHFNQIFSEMEKREKERKNSFGMEFLPVSETEFC